MLSEGLQVKPFIAINGIDAVHAVKVVAFVHLIVFAKPFAQLSLSLIARLALDFRIEGRRVQNRQKFLLSFVSHAIPPFFPYWELPEVYYICGPHPLGLWLY